MAKRVAIVGGGITGLAAAFELEKAFDIEVDLYEASSRLGGKLRTATVDGLLVEGGPDCFFSRRPGTLELIRELGIEDELIAPKAGEFSMLVGGQLHGVPRGLVTLNAPDHESIRSATFLSDGAKARALEPQTVEGADPTIRSFFTQRFGAEFSRLVAEPLLAGTHGGDPDRLSMKALYPAYLSPPPATEGAKGPNFLSFRNGMRTLVEALHRSLKRTRIHLDARLDALPEADRVLVAVPANHASKLLPGIGLESIAHRSSAIATFAFERRDVSHPLDGTGFLVPPAEPSAISGATWSSQKWPDRAPEATVLMRVFMREGEESTALAAITPLLGIVGKPTFSRLDRWEEALPQYEVGHLDRIAKIEAGLPPHVTLAGTSYRGVGIPDCLRQGREAGRAIAQSL